MFVCADRVRFSDLRDLKEYAFRRCARKVDQRTVLTIRELSRKICAREISPVEITHECLARIERLNPKLNAFITVNAESALDQARIAEREIFRGNYRGPSTAFRSDSKT